MPTKKEISTAKWRARNIEHVRAYARKYMKEYCKTKKSQEYRRKYAKKWFAENKDRRKIFTDEIRLKWRQEHPDGVKAHHIVREAIRKGELKKPTNCQTCNKGNDFRLEGHHDDYSKPLEVLWLCRSCHRYRHSQ